MPHLPSTRPFQEEFITPFISGWTTLLVRQLADPTIKLTAAIHHDKPCDRLVVTCTLGTEPAVFKRRFVCKAKPIHAPHEIPPIIAHLEGFMVEIRAWAASARQMAELKAAEATGPPKTRGRPRVFHDEHEDTPAGRRRAWQRAYYLKKKAARMASHDP